MRIVFNASTVKYGGGLYVALNLLRAITNNLGNNEVFVICPGEVGFEKFHRQNAQYWVLPDIMLKLSLRWVLECLILKKIQKFKPHIILNLTNLPLKTRFYQIFLNGNAFNTINDFKNLNINRIGIIELKLRNYFFRKRLTFVDKLITQTQLQKIKLSRFYPESRIDIIHLPISSFLDERELSEDIPLVKDGETIYLLNLYRYYPHKNIEVLLEVAELIKKNRTHFKILITIDKEHGKGAKKILKEIKKRKLQNEILNIGYISHNSIGKLLLKVDALLLPTLLESYGFPYIEAMHYRIPIFTSNRDFSFEVCKDIAFYFNPFEPKEIYDLVNNVFSNKDLIKKKMQLAKIYVDTLPEWEKVINKLYDKNDT